MNPSEEFLRHAADCQRMAKFHARPPRARRPGIAWRSDGFNARKFFDRQACDRKGPAPRHRKAAAEFQHYRQAGVEFARPVVPAQAGDP